jgi:hypothetical protein
LPVPCFLLLALGGRAYAQPPAPAAPDFRERIGIIDLTDDADDVRRARRDKLEAELSRSRGVRPVDDAGLRRALAGEESDPQLADGRRALVRAQSAFGALDCKAARGEADRAVLGLAAAQAAGVNAAEELRRAHAIRFVCADQGGDRSAAQGAAAALRRLRAGDPPAGVSDAVWSRYPAMDAATGVQNARLAITSQPAGAAIWIDHVRAGKTPVTVSLAEGEHVVAAGSRGRATARRVTVATSWVPASLALVIPAGGGARWSQVEARVRSWRSRASRPDAASIGDVLTRAGLATCVLIDARGKHQVWQRGAGRQSARHLGNAAGAAEIDTLVAGARGPGIDPDRPLLRETPEESAALRGESKGSKWKEWWVYAVVIGAAAVGAGIVVANDIGDDQQRIEITVP